MTYITDVNFSSIDSKFKTGYRKNFGAAKKYMDENYPNLKNMVVDGVYEMVTPIEKCVEESSSVILVPYKAKK